MSGSMRQPQFAIRFFVTSVCVLTLSFLLGQSLIRALPPSFLPEVQFPPAFAASTLAVLFGSLFLSRAVAAVRRERQVEFRRQLLLALIAGGLFVALQMSALHWLIHRQSSVDVPTGATAFVVVMASLHALHFVVAILCLVFVWLKARGDRYDHEYYWGVTVCAWFWHALSIVWVAVLGVVAIASQAA